MSSKVHSICVWSWASAWKNNQEMWQHGKIACERPGRRHMRHWACDVRTQPLFASESQHVGVSSFSQELWLITAVVCQGPAIPKCSPSHYIVYPVWIFWRWTVSHGSSGSLGAQSAAEWRGKWRGGRGGSYRRGRASNRVGSKEDWREGEDCGSGVSPMRFAAGGEGWHPCPTCQSEREGEEGTDLGRASWAAGQNWRWARWFPRVFFIFFPFPFFLFLLFWFIYNFCILDPNWFKLICKIS
jgi:hypothetical protein